MDWNRFFTTEGLAVFLGILWATASANGWFPQAVAVDLTAFGLGPTQMSPAWLFGYALVRTAKKTAIPGEMPFTSDKKKEEG